ncbi:endonuclease [Xanthomonas citri pv. glycines]|uniref:Endonuclease n=2 Tax=Xanthomonas TaxID=338 RepID=A0AAX0I529_XANCG|nr:endonuclease [Xanthomonas citri pv. glycines str. 12-2]EKQ58724.1 endonuclease [Xanthomonas citri pv. malvacearum str. GSPB2388]KGR52244.1 endonuclease [Xanthomonas vasicola]OEY98739.1 endonuclease [Xanthomonas citri pv. glycines]OOW59291.1 endonuclease [Xanthomonas campestris pv. thespesiae]OOW75152.1 endonuclease [Xanthomonas campestris pv. leeana]OOW81347.1 endonuclease [Xanthomonas axonopodis pv. clitoriae]OOW84912.1 endonuclease [Xanthomonas campestris pv. vitiswoodrowii]
MLPTYLGAANNRTSCGGAGKTLLKRRAGERPPVPRLPNSATLGSLGSYIVSINELEDTFGASTIGITAPANVKAMLPATTWPQTSGCDLS